MNEPQAPEYPREAPSPRERPVTYPKDGRLGVYVAVVSGVGLFQEGLRALGIGVAAGTLRHAAAIVLAVLLLVRVVGGFGLTTSRLWAFFAVLLPSLALIALTVRGITRHGSPMAFLWLLFSVYVAIYCVVRMVGLDGPRPR